MEAWLNEVNEAVLFVGLFGLLLGAAELGSRLARREDREPGKTPAHASAMQGAVLGLLALLLGFTFSLAVNRLEQRKELLRDEANAIGTTYLRVQLLPEPMRSALPPILRSYTETRIELNRVAAIPERVREVHARASALHQRMWQLAVAAARTAPESEVIALFIDSLNQTIDMHGLRIAAIRNHIPALLFVLLCGVAAVALALSGYASGAARRPELVLNGLMALLITAVTVLVFDLHRPTRGLVRADPASLIELRDSMR